MFSILCQFQRGVSIISGGASCRLPVTPLWLVGGHGGRGHPGGALGARQGTGPPRKRGARGVGSQHGARPQCRGSQVGAAVRAWHAQQRPRPRGHHQEIQNPALTELLRKLRDLAYKADDALDELDYFRIQDQLEGTYHAADKHDGGCLRNNILNARHTVVAMGKKLVGFSKCCGGSASHNEQDEHTRRGVSCGDWPCLGLTTPVDNEDQEEDDDQARRGARCGAGCWPCGRASAAPPIPPTSQGNQEVGHGCISRLASGARHTIHAVGKHLPCHHSASCVQCNGTSNTASSGLEVIEHNIQAPKLKFNRVEMSQTIKEIVEQLKPVCAKVSTILNLELLDSNRTVAQWIATSLDGRLSNKQWHTPFHKNSLSSRPITTSDPIEPELLGREDKTSKIIHDIIKGEYCDKALTVLPIVGPGGIGKTTLTQHLYNDVELKKHFDVRLWVCVSANFNVHRLTQEIADKLGNNDKKDNPDKLIGEKLKSQRFLLVLDDMWNYSDEDEWKKFLAPFKKGQRKGNVILVTTRLLAVAQMVKIGNHHIDLEGLNQKAFKQLFLAYVFGDNKQTQNDHEGLLDIGDTILEKLKGSPLAAKTVGRLLRKNLDLDHWTRVSESREWESQTGDHDIMPALRLSFDYLPFHLQQCFVYCALFPQDYKFDGKEIIHLWIGLDVLHSSHNENKSIEDVGLSHLTELVNHGFFKMEEKEDGDTCYAIHDLLHDLALKVSAHECLSISTSDVSSTQIPPSIRHLSVNIDDSSVKDKTIFDACKEDFSALGNRIKVENLHSLMLFGKHQISFVKTFRVLFSKAKALRVIFLSEVNYSMEHLLPNYLNFIHLRYLRISGLLIGSGSALSNNVSRYYHLRVLDLKRFYPEHYDLPRDMSNLVNLRHFLINEGGNLHTKISKLGRLKSLQDLERFMVKKESQGFELREIGHLVELKSLQIDNLEKIQSREEAGEAKLMQKKHLRMLGLKWSTDQSDKDPMLEEEVLGALKPNSNLSRLVINGHGGATCPSWLGGSLLVKHLEYLRMENIAWKTFPPIGKFWLVNEEVPSDLSNLNFYNLRRVELVNLEGVKKWIVDSTSQFYSCLKVLIIVNCSELIELSFSDSTYTQQQQNKWFPKLQELRICDCPKLLSFPTLPWARDPCLIWIKNVGLIYLLHYQYGLSMHITRNVDDDTDEVWMALEFENLTEVKKLAMNNCPPLSLDRLRMMSSLEVLQIVGYSSNAIFLVEEEQHVQFQLPVERIEIHSVGSSGKELTQVFSYMPKLSEMSIQFCHNITGLGVVKQQKTATSSSNWDWVTRAVNRLVPWRINGQFPATSCSSHEAYNPTREADDIAAAERVGLLLLPPQLQKLTLVSCKQVTLNPDSLGLQCLHSLRSFKIRYCPNFFSSYLASSSSSPCSPFPTSLQYLTLVGLSARQPAAADCIEGKSVTLSNLASLAELYIFRCGNGRGFSPTHGMSHAWDYRLLASGYENLDGGLLYSNRIPSFHPFLHSI
ncbi:hypothetical protein EJB05_27024, partial [Eragrostis curvula]